MATDQPTITLHMAASLDGYIASADGSHDWLETSDSYDQGVDGEDPEEFLKTIDCWVMGARSYETTLELGWPYGDIRTVVLTHRDLPRQRETVEFYQGSLPQLLEQRLAGCRNIWVVGGAAVTRDFLQAGLASDVVISVLPLILGGGTPFFDQIGKLLPLHLKDVTAYKNGIVELSYQLRTD